MAEPDWFSVDEAARIAIVLDILRQGERWHDTQ